MRVFAIFAIKNKVLFFATAAIFLFARIAGYSIYGAPVADTALRALSARLALTTLTLIRFPEKSINQS